MERRSPGCGESSAAWGGGCGEASGRTYRVARVTSVACGRLVARGHLGGFRTTSVARSHLLIHLGHLDLLWSPGWLGAISVSRGWAQLDGLGTPWWLGVTSVATSVGWGHLGAWGHLLALGTPHCLRGHLGGHLDGLGSPAWLGVTSLSWGSPPQLGVTSVSWRSPPWLRDTLVAWGHLCVTLEPRGHLLGLGTHLGGLGGHLLGSGVPLVTTLVAQSHFLGLGTSWWHLSGLGSSPWWLRVTSSAWGHLGGLGTPPCPGVTLVAPW